MAAAPLPCASAKRNARASVRILAAINFIKDKVEQLPTKDDVRAIIREEIDDVVPGIVVLELAPIRAELKEIDHVLERIAAIEKHLGIEKKIAA